MDVQDSSGKMDRTGVVLTSRRDDYDVFMACPHLSQARDSGEWPVVSGTVPQFGDYEAQAVMKHSEVRETLNSAVAISGPNPETAPPTSIAAQPGFILFRDGEEHSRIRRVIARYFTVRSVGGLRPRVEELVTEMLDQMEAKGREGDVVTDFALPLTTHVICEVLGVPYEDREAFGSWTGFISDRDADPADAVAAIRNIRSYIASLVENIRENPTPSLLRTIIEEHDDVVSDEELIGVGMMTLMAGHDTSAASIAFGTLALLAHPEQARAIREDDSIVMPAIEEILRYASPVQPHYRKMTGDTTVGDREVKAGDHLLVSLLAANFDPELVGDDPGFNIHRGVVPHVAFGFGPHQCPGQHLARLEMAIAIPALLRRFPDLRVTVADHELKTRDNSSIRTLKSLPVAW